MSTQCKHCPLNRRGAFVDLSPTDIELMQKFKTGEIAIEAGAPILTQGSNAPQLFTVLSGLAIRERHLQDGKRQVISFVFPGDFIGLQADMLGEMGHTVAARTSMRLCVFNRSELWDFFRSNPKRAFDITWHAAMEESFLSESIATVGQRSAVSAVAWAMIKIFQRAEALGLTQGNTLNLPFTQRDIADAMGLSLVHTNKTLNKIKQRRLASLSDGVLQINDLKALAEVAMTELRPPPKRPLI